MKENTYKMIAIDLDDTLLNDSLEISPKNLEALRKAHENHVKIVICTGRPYPSTKKFVDQLTFLDDGDCFVSFNGALITKVSGEELFKEFISKSYIEALIALSKEHEENLQLYTKFDMLVDHYDDITQKYESMSGMTAVVVDSIASIDETAKALFNGRNPQTLDLLQDIIKSRFKGELNCFYSKPTFLEVLNHKANKGLAVEHIAEIFDIKPQEIIAIGDSYNDLFMIEYAGMGVAVKNARDALKEAADYVTEATNDEDAIAEVVNRFILN